MTLDELPEKGEFPVTVARRLKEELDSWRPYTEALRLEDREVFRDMLNAVAASYIEAVDKAERGYVTEAVMVFHKVRTGNTSRPLLVKDHCGNLPPADFDSMNPLALEFPQPL